MRPTRYCTKLLQALVFILSAGAALLVVSGCGRDDRERVVIYTAVDPPYARPILEEFERRTGIRVIMQMDAEAAKTVGLAERLRAEQAAGNPQADVWWGNEIFYTIGLAEDGVLAAYESPAAEGIPALFRDPEHRWAGTGLRARVICVWDAEQRQADRETGGEREGLEWVRSLEDLADARLRGRIAMARPTAGTTGGHVAAMYVLWGEDRANRYFRSLHENGIRLLGGNAQVADQTGHGVILAGLTDNDDVAASLREGGRLRQVLPDQETYGTLTIPTTVGLVAGGSNPDGARQLIDYLLSPEVEQQLIAMGFAGYSVRDDAGEQAVRSMEIDYREAARIMPQAIRTATAILEGR
jgi:iron(III) transport system substrate-binding protein